LIRASQAFLPWVLGCGDSGFSGQSFSGLLRLSADFDVNHLLFALILNDFFGKSLLHDMGVHRGLPLASERRLVSS
jgi:hypothetical protein